MVIVIDNYDSFVYNLVRYVLQWGHAVQVYRHDAITGEEVLQLNPSHIILSPGPGRPEEAGNQRDIIHHCHQTIPLLGVCLGHQGIAQYFGADIHRISPCHGKASAMAHNQSDIFQSLPSPLTAGRYHSLAIAPDTLPSTLHVLATLHQQPEMIMAIAHQDYPCIGLQFHPESILTPQGFDLIGAFLNQKKG